MTNQLVENKTGKYLYAVIDALDDFNYNSCGIDDGDVYTLDHKGVKVVVSDVVNKRMRPERQHIAAHQKVLEKVMEKSTPLPVIFGTIADDHKEVEKILTHNREMCLEKLAYVADKVEMGLRVIWDVPNIFEYFVQIDSELMEARNHFFGSSQEPSREDKMELGRIFDRNLKAAKEEHTEHVEEILSEYCCEVKRNRPYAERDIMNLACLVERDAQDKFEVGVFEVAKIFDNNFGFDFNGPWAPHNFVEIDLKPQ